MARGRPRKWTDELIEKEAELLLEWSDKDEALVMGTHYGKRLYTNADSADWEKSNEYFKYCKGIALTRVGARRELFGLKGKLDSALVKASLACYDPVYRAFLIEMKREKIVEDLLGEDAAKELSKILKAKSAVKK